MAWVLCHIDDSFSHTMLLERGSDYQQLDDDDALHHYLQEDYLRLVAFAGELDEDQQESARERFEQLCDVLEGQALAEALNDLTVGLRRIVYLGQLRDLCEESSPFADALRRYFWEEDDEGDEDDPTAPVPPERADDLVATLEDFLVEGDYRHI
ncbi:hypothetical protein [Gallaecimonas xiamenensis]|uniref:Uncharacterized protein n=1 Tax=Gallaecimonas xiamenensis 3-C-1 TaxID=745411 RepID=K2JU49_9GAMM|nr:hypothetical protein [Gallaecimonas xiamenensis]EKE78032.1 hypothetical protein B3C1_01190 [Gallaecimonas xiamenensis 3-C-1]